jgi:hypothetical protein
LRHGSVWSRCTARWQTDWIPCIAAGRAIGGEVVKYWAFAQQLSVERYFAGAGVLTPLYYWIGISRVAKTMSFAYTYDKAPLGLVGSGSCLA